MAVTMGAVVKFEAIEEWNLWKTEHGRQYSSPNVSPANIPPLILHTPSRQYLHIKSTFPLHPLGGIRTSHCLARQ